MARFDQQVAIVTGSASGIGKEIAIRFAREGGIPVIADLNLDAAQFTADEIKSELGIDAVAFEIDVTNEEQVNAWVDAVVVKDGKVNPLVCKTGVLIVKALVVLPYVGRTCVAAILLDGVFF